MSIFKDSEKLNIYRLVGRELHEYGASCIIKRGHSVTINTTLGIRVGIGITLRETYTRQFIGEIFEIQIYSIEKTSYRQFKISRTNT